MPANKTTSIQSQPGIIHGSGGGGAARLLMLLLFMATVLMIVLMNKEEGRLSLHSVCRRKASLV